ncbi:MULTISPECIES: CusA/CzcA family heavy metal efflux RND transporter [unclassified Polynucleobacter]|uniref:efflux RND transporter permease subunit n=1 Tax=unclassified Polynucleobacter TaxID=2640945 RepID=UPI0008C2EC95|nr:MULTISPECIES: CusA/CzcA family heavy metal efflux RND transporter [unclassified Polynucleobacter]OHC09365.1 MAG: heavy metal resistance protein CzcA [Polynucleobacter sp. GWA2_45_21]HBK43934.1 CusA/CzcA family heavy metal efflux RND transporter [Polynucleobacter sp.]
MSAFTSFIRGVLEKRVLVIVGSIVLLGLGMYSLSKLPIQPYPGVAPLTIQAISQWPGRSTTEVEQQVTIPVENALAGIPGLQAFRSVSLFGLSVVTLKFNDTTDPFQARQRFITSLSNVNFPDGVTSSVSPDSDATGEIMRYEVKSDYASSTDLKTLQNYEIYKELKQTPGVADVSSFGGKVRQYQVIVSPESLQAKGVTVNELITALTNANSNTGGGLLPSGEQQFVVRGVGLLKSIDDIKRVVVSTHNGVPIRIGDVASVVIGNAPRLGMFQFNDNPDSVEGIVYLRRGENATEVLARVRNTVENINKQILPPGIEVKPFYDRQVLLDITIGTVKHTLFFGISLVLAVLFFFLGNLRAAAVVAAVIPLALCVSFIQMHLWSVPANLISLGAIDFGVIVDSAVILTENVMRHLEEGGKRLNQSIILATSEVQRAMIYSTGIIIVAYSPLFFMGGVEGIIFKPMAFTMGFALIAAMILSLTFLPAMISLVFGENLHHKPPRFITKLLDGYKPLLRRWMDRPLTVVSVAVFVLGLTLLSVTRLGTAFLPTLEENNIWLRVTLPNTVDLDYSVKVANQLRETFLKQPEIEKVAAQIGRPDDGTDSTGVFNQEYGLYLKSPDKMPSGSGKKELIANLEIELKKIPGITYSFSQYIQDNVNEALSGVKGENSIKIYGTDLEVLDQKAQEVIFQLKKVRGVADEGILKELGQPTLNIQIDRERAARYGINVNDIQTLVSNAIGGAAVTNLLEDEKTFGVAIRLSEGSRNDVADIGRLLVDSPSGAAIPLSMVATVQLSDGPFFIYREAGKRYIAIKFSVRNRDLGSAVEDAQFLVEKNITLPPNYSISWDGQFNQMKQAQKKLMLIVPLALVGIFLLLVSAFGNFRDAVIVMINVPFAAIGGVIALHLAGETLSISAFFGFLSLFGIAIQDGVILISFINKTAATEHRAMKDAMVEGASLRVRPVLMTAALSGLGLLPAALSHSIGSEAQRPLALVIVGGMVTTTILTLLVLPVIYGWFRGRALTQMAKA